MGFEVSKLSQHMKYKMFFYIYVCRLGGQGYSSHIRPSHYPLLVCVLVFSVGLLFKCDVKCNDVACTVRVILFSQWDLKYKMFLYQCVSSKRTKVCQSYAIFLLPSACVYMCLIVFSVVMRHAIMLPVVME